MPHREPLLQLDPRFTHLVEADDSFVLVSDEDSAVLEGRAVAELLPLLDGRRTGSEIAQVMEDRYRPELVYFALLGLEAEGLIRPIAHTPQGERALARTAVAWRAPRWSGAPSDAADEDLPEGWKGDLPRGASALSRAWHDRGDRSAVVSTIPGSSLIILLTDDYLTPDAAALVQACRPAPLVMARVGLVDVWLGPLVGGNDGCCLACLQERLRINLTARALTRTAERTDHSAEHGGDIRVHALARPLPEEAFRLLAEGLYDAGPEPPWGPSSLVVHRLDGTGSVSHRCHRLPHCGACGDPLLGPPGADVEIKRRPLRGTSGGGYRVCDPDETWRRFSPLISPLTGVVRRVEKVEVPDADLIHVYTASQAGTYDPVSVRTVKDDTRDHSGGKGMTDLDARVSALCEALERFSAVHRGDEPSRHARLSELGRSGIHPNEVMGFSDRQFGSRADWNAGLQGGFQWVPEPYENQVIEWSPLRSLTTGEVVWLPSALLYLGYRGEGSRFCKGDSNGLAGGNVLEEAVLQGVLELVERDAIALWWYNRGHVTGLNLANSTDEYVHRIAGYYRSIRRSLWVLDLTTDLGIPVFAALSALVAQEREDIMFGFGCHLDPGIALRRALTELNQMIPTVQRPLAERKKQLLPEFGDAIKWWEEARVADHSYLEPARGGAWRDVGDAPALDSQNLRDAIELCVGRAASSGLDVLVCDQTRPDVRFPVAKVVVPGLRHFWRRLGPGRLFDVPRRLGWVDGILTEDDMNPVSMFV